MARKDYTPEQAIGMLREVEVRLSQGEKIGKICRGLGIGALQSGVPIQRRLTINYLHTWWHDHAGRHSKFADGIGDELFADMNKQHGS